MVIIYMKSSFVGDLRKMMTTTFNQLKIGQLLGTKSAFNLNAPKKVGLPTSAALGLSAVAHLIVALVLFQQINLTPTSSNQIQAPITIRLISEPKKEAIPVPQPQIQKITPKPQAKAVMSTPNSSTFTTQEKIQTPSKESTHEAETKVEHSAPPASADSAKKVEEKGESAPVYVAPKFGADYLQNPSPEYPGMSRRRGEQGKVLLKVFVSPQGQAEKVLLEKTSGFELLDKSAIDVVKTWKFIPASSNNQPVSGVVIVPIRFSLDS